MAGLPTSRNRTPVNAASGIPSAENEKDLLEKDIETDGDNIGDEDTSENEEKIITSTPVSTTPQPAVTFVRPNLTTSKEEQSKMVKIRVKRDHSCTIGIIKYVFKKNEVRNVPLNVKKVLERADLLNPL